MHVETLGSGPNIVLVHGSIRNGQNTWKAQLPLAEHYRLLIPDRPGYPPNPPEEREDFEEHARLISGFIPEESHLVGFSYGGVISLFAASLCKEKIRSLTVIEPPAFGIVSGKDEVSRFVLRFETHWANSPRDPKVFLEGFRKIIAGRPSEEPPEPFTPEIEQGVRLLMVERLPWDADPPLDELRLTSFPKLVISGGHHPAFESVCDVLESELQAERDVLRGNGHRIPDLGFSLNERLKKFFEKA